MGTKPHCGILLTSFNPWTKGLVELYTDTLQNAKSFTLLFKVRMKLKQ